MDEPTSGLTEGETQILFGIIERLKKQGVAIVYITHRLEEVFRLTDRVTVLRDGKTVANLNTSETTSAELVQLMAGKAVSEE
ncbi:MAG TPA: D-xylose ABC transporter ATP-binding protein, partial [Firmicutes bacterium]|nr:D-xylose ABC transporter ATP-binding protein [Bacillota bacterium]